MSSRWWVVLLLATSMVAAAEVDLTAEVAEDSSLASTLVTPHKAWGKDWFGGPLRVLAFVYTGSYEGTWEDTGTRVRELVELAQRFDLEADAVPYCGRGDQWVFHGLGAGEARAEKLLEQPYDLYLIAGFAFDRLPAKIQYLILKQVAAGSGLLCCGYAAKDFMVAKRKVDPTPAALVDGLPELDGKRARDVVSAYTLGKGRGVWLNTGNPNSISPAVEFSWRAQAEYDYRLMLVGRAALWAAGRESDLSLTVLGDQAVSAARGAAVPLGVALANAGKGTAAVSVALELRRLADGLKLPLGEPRVSVPAGQQATVDIAMPQLRTGDYVLDAIVRTGRGVEAFGAGNLTVTSDVGVESVTLDPPFVERGDPIHGTVALRGTPPAGAVLRVAMRDSYHRVLWQQNLELRGQPESFEYAPDTFATELMSAEATLLEGDAEVDQQSATFTVPKRRQGRFNFVMWDMANNVLGYDAQRQLQRAGYEVCLMGSMGSTPRAMPPAVLACDVSMVPYSTRILDPKDENGHMLPVCWNDDAAANEYVQRIVDNQINLRQMGVFLYSLGDEGVTKGACTAPTCLDAYRAWLQTQYPDIGALNASWGSTYGSFAEVNLLDPKDNMEQAALKTSPARWYDRQAFARANLLQFSGRFVKAYEKLDPHGLTGFEGTGGFGDDYDGILATNTWYSPYPSLGDDILRGTAPQGYPHANWMGYSKTGDALSDAAWRMVIKGMNSVWFWMWSGIGSWRGYLRPTLDYWPATQDLTNEMRPVRQGLGDLLMHADMQDSGIAVLYTLPSALSDSVENSGQYVRGEEAHNFWVHLAYELGRDVKYQTSRTLLENGLDPAEVKLLLLPMTQALTPQEVAAIRSYAERGGTVLADVRPGIYDGHCKPAEPGLLDDLFGITRTGRGSPTEGPVEVKAELGGRRLEATLPRTKLDPDVRAAGAEALAQAGETPLLLVNQVGRGRAILLNFQPLVGKWTDEPEAVAARALGQFLFGVAGAEAQVKLAAPDGGPVPQLESRIWRTGDGLVIGAMRHMENAWFSPRSGTQAGAAETLRITLPTARYVYDLRAGKALGKTTRVATELSWGRANFFLALPYELPKLAVRLDDRTPQRGQTLAAEVELDLPATADETFAAWLEVIPPDGEAPLWGQQVVLLPGGRATVPLRVAFNDAPGRWRVRARELFSGQTAEAAWTLR